MTTDRVKTLAELEAELAEKSKALEAAEARGRSGEERASKLEKEVDALKKRIAELEAAKPEPKAKPAAAPSTPKPSAAEEDDDGADFLVL